MRHLPSEPGQIDVIAVQPHEDPEEAFALAARGGANRVEIRDAAHAHTCAEDLRSRGRSVRLLTLNAFRALLSGTTLIDQEAQKHFEAQVRALGFT